MKLTFVIFGILALFLSGGMSRAQGQALAPGQSQVQVQVQPQSQSQAQAQSQTQSQPLLPLPLQKNQTCGPQGLTHLLCGRDGGGGDLEYPSLNDLQNTVDKTFDIELSQLLGWFRDYVELIADPDVKRVFKEFYGPTRKPFGVYSSDEGSWKVILDEANIRFTKGLCPGDDALGHAASVSSFTFGADICYSKKVLLKVPKASLDDQFIAITAHELSHEYGEGEVVARKVYEFVLSQMLPLSRGTSSVTIKDFLSQFQNPIMNLQSKFTVPQFSWSHSPMLPQSEAGLFCAQVGQILGKAQDLESLISKTFYWDENGSGGLLASVIDHFADAARNFSNSASVLNVRCYNNAVISKDLDTDFMSFKQSYLALEAASPVRVYNPPNF